jgi:hypothetical protein
LASWREKKISRKGAKAQSFTNNHFTQSNLGVLASWREKKISRKGAKAQSFTNNHFTQSNLGVLASWREISPQDLSRTRIVGRRKGAKFFWYYFVK